MCCFSRNVRSVGGTKIFARGLEDGQQWLVYAMDVELDEELAMILPLPVPANAGEHAVTFLDLQGEVTFFDELSSAFPPLGPQTARAAAAPPPRLVVHEVGPYEASYVPTAADFERLDPRFRMPPGFFAALPAYGSDGFAVFRLKPRRGVLGTKQQTIQPMAFAFPRREPSALFFPTVHVHDGAIASRAAFDHALYCQAEGVLGATLGWSRSRSPLGDSVSGPRSREVVAPAQGGFAQALWGDRRNDDVWLRPPRGVTLRDLSGGGECYAFEAKASWAYATDTEQSDRVAWVQSAQRLARLCHGLREGLAELEVARRRSWRLGPLRDALPPHFMNGPQLWAGTSYMNGAPAQSCGPSRVAFTPFSQRVEPQRVELGFSQLPSPGEAASINAELCRLLDRLV